MIIIITIKEGVQKPKELPATALAFPPPKAQGFYIASHVHGDLRQGLGQSG